MRTAGSRSGRRCSDQWLVLKGVRENCWECLGVVGDVQISGWC